MMVSEELVSAISNVFAIYKREISYFPLTGFWGFTSGFYGRLDAVILSMFPDSKSE